jgi:hypothetical protein
LEFGNNFHGKRGCGATDAFQRRIEIEFLGRDAMEESEEYGRDDEKIRNLISEIRDAELDFVLVNIFNKSVRGERWLDNDSGAVTQL